jgi:hypothetical protein
MMMMLRCSRRYFNSSLIIISIAGALLSGCSKGGGANSLRVKTAPTGDKELQVKSSFAFPVTKSFTDLNQNITTAVTYYVYAANYELDAGNFAMTLDKPMAVDDQVRVVFNLVGEEGTRDPAALKTGTYSAKADKYMKVETVGIVTRRGNADMKYWFDRSALNGQVNIASVSDNSFSGDIDVTAGENTIKGSFTAKILKRK